MARLARFLIAAFLAFAVPLQGLAGLTMAACGSAHGVQVTHDQAMGHDHSAMQHDHSNMGHGESIAHQSSGGDNHEDHAVHRCAACAACCSVSAAPVQAFVFHGASPAPSLAIPFLETDRASFQPARLERPPSPSYIG